MMELQKRRATILVQLIWLLATICSTIEAKEAAAAAAANKQQHLEAASQLSERCASIQLRPFESLADYQQFYQAFGHLHECLHSLKEPELACQRAEVACERVGINQRDVRPLGQLIDRYAINSEPVCTIEYSSKIYRLHKQLVADDGGRPAAAADGGSNGGGAELARVLRQLATRVAAGCRKSLPARLLEVEQRTTSLGAERSEASKFVDFVNKFLVLKRDLLERIRIEPEWVVPIYEDEHWQAQRERAIARDGYEFKLIEQIQTTLEAIKLSCQNVRTYQLNLLGSLGTLASLGYAPGAREQQELTASETGEQRARVAAWSLSAILCQSIRGILRMAKVKVDDKMFMKVKIVANTEPDVSVLDEQDDAFARFELTELTRPDERNLTSVAFEPAAGGGGGSELNLSQINARKQQLLRGPNYRLAKAIYSYVNPLESEQRFRIPFELLGVETPREFYPDTAQQQADEEEEEEEE